jgi:hypothetical protein
VDPPETPDHDWLLRLLCADPPRGVYRHAADGDTLLTLATFVVDLARATVTVVARGATPLELTIPDFSSGRPVSLKQSTGVGPPLATHT